MPVLRYDSPAMRTASVPAVEPRVLPPLPSKQELLRWFQEIKGAATAYRKALASVAFYGWKLREVEAWTILGYETEEDMRTATGIPQSTWHKHVRLGGILRNLTLPELEAIPTANLDLLAQVGTELWAEHAWVEEAKTKEPNELAELITTRNRAIGSAYEPRAVYRESVPYSAKKMIETAVTTFQEQHELASRGAALELMIADNFDRPSFVGGYIKIRRMLLDLKVLLQQKGILDPDVHEFVADMRVYIGEKLTEAVSLARQGKINPNGCRWADENVTEPSGEIGTEAAQGAAVEEPGRVLREPSLSGADEVERRVGV